MDTNKKTININNFLIWCMATIYFFFPRRFYLLDIYSFRFIIIGVLILSVVYNRFVFGYTKKFMTIPALFFCVAALRYLVAGRYTTGLGYLLDTIILAVVMSNLIQTRKDFEKYITWFCGFIGIYSILGIVECLTGFNLWNTITGSTDLVYVRYGLYRSYGSMTNFTNNAFFLLLSIILVIWKVQNCRDNQKIKYIAILILVNLNILATLTRSAILLASLLYLILFFRGGMIRFVKKYFLPILIFCTCITIVFMFSETAVNAVKMLANMFVAIVDEDTALTISSEFGGNESGVGNRFQLYSWVLESIKGNEIYGVGPREFAYNWIRSDGRIMIKESLENQYLSVLYRFGIVGLCLYIPMIFGFFYNVYKYRKKFTKIFRANQRGLGWETLVLTAILTYYLGGFFYAYADDSRLFMIIICLFYSFLIINLKENNKIFVTKPKVYRHKGRNIN